MDLLENYLAAVRRNLPSHEAADIVAELRDILLSKAEEQEGRTGSTDWTTLLRDFGHPLSVAAGYRKQQWLIGPQIYPFYVHFLKVIVGIVLAVVTGIALLKATLWASSVGPAITDWLGSLWWAAASAVGSVTILFVVIEKFSRQSVEQCTNWKPTELPDAGSRQPSKYNSMFEVGAGVLFLLWWVGALPTPHFTNGQFRLEAAPVWANLFWPITALLAGRLVYNLLLWLRPRWTNVRWVFGAATALGGVAILATVYRAGEWMRVVPAGMSPTEAAGLQAAINMALNIAIVVIVIVWIVGLAGEIWRLTRSLSGKPGAAQSETS